jgi:hypothetical protein
MKIVLVLTCFLLVSCASPLVGEWRYADQTQSCRYHFKRDGRFMGEVSYRSKLVSKFTGTWSVKGDRLLYTYISDDFGRIPPGATDQDKLLSVQKGSFLIEAADGSRRRYARIR